MKKNFLIRVLLFILPVLLYLAVPAAILYHYKENFHEVDDLIDSGREYRIGYALNEKNYHYLKWKTLVSTSRKEVWALGSSRVLQFRSKMFERSFYNAGYTITGIDEFVPFLMSIPKEKYPKYLIVGLDQWMFNKQTDDLSSVNDINHWKNSFRKSPKSYVLKMTWWKLLKGDFDFSRPDRSDFIRVGLAAHFNDLGFRKDGSMDYGDFDQLLNNDPNYVDYNYKNTFSRIESGTAFFQHSDSINPEAVKKFRDLLEFCKNQNIKLVAFLPPFANRVYAKMEESGNYRYLKQITPAIANLAEQFDFEFYDFSTMAKCGSTDVETIDGFHGSEHTYLKILLKMVDAGSVLDEVINREKLLRDEAKRINRYNIYE